ncbi:hypothetical protein COLSTE_02273 [Collinsella stercoris DSM 13279]|uniref:DUF4013 domain-containing protein n=2 Tax=Collinsella TaxID=102106 RepID=B6GDT8_9ACTN|nr:hypothetical protein COLSTE_02273 [Collinsella stercoris DSM 13279]
MMYAQNLGFMSSWHMLTRDKGWVKPVLVLTLVGWIPILGQIVLMGYGLEWARLTAWGVDAAPKQRGVDYGKVFSTGGRAFLVSLSLGFVIALVLQVVFPGSLYMLFTGLTAGNAVSVATAMASGAAMSILTMVVSIAMGTFLQAATLRATLYDSFSAGWRLDRLFQMIGRDFGGFLKVLLVTLIGGAISGVYAFVVSLVLMLVVMGGVMSATAFVGLSGSYMNGWHFLLEQLLRIGAGPLLLFIVVVIALAFVGSAISTAMSLVSMNAMGQWFCRFDVHRWGVSADPLPSDVPHRGGASDSGMGAPVNPTASDASTAQPDSNGNDFAQSASWSQSGSQGATTTDSADCGSCAAPVQPVAPVDSAAAAQSTAPAQRTAPVEPAAPVESTQAAGAECPAEAPVAPSAASLERVVSLDSEEYAAPAVDEEAAREAAEAAARSIAEEQGLSGTQREALGREAEGDCGPAKDESGSDGAVDSSGEAPVEPDASKKPIPLGPITSHDDEPQENGPIQA